MRAADLGSGASSSQVRVVQDNLAEVLEVESLAEAPEKPTDTFVMSDAKVWHRVSAHGRVGPSATWSSTCGWKFAGREAKASESLPVGLGYRQYCAKCLSEQRAAAS